MVGLACVVYASPITHPAELLDPDRFGDPAAIEEHLLDAFIPAAYADFPRPPAPDGSRPTIPRYLPDQAQAWLTFLAGHLDERHTRDLAWWEMYRALRRGKMIVGVIIQTVSGLVAGIGIGIGTGPTSGAAAGFAGGLGMGLVTTPPTSPWQMHVQGRGRLRQLPGRLLAGLAVGLTLAFVVGLALQLALPVSFSAGLTLGLGFGIMEWLSSPADTIRSVSPTSVLHNDRAASGIRLLVGGVGFGVVGGLAIGPGVRPINALAVGLVGGLVLGTVGRIVGRRGTGLAGSAWGWYLASRWWLALQGKLPWRLTTFLDDSHRRGVLRQVGAVYQFRHARLQDRLTVDSSKSPR
jgi:hypothetical protein